MDLVRLSYPFSLSLFLLVCKRVTKSNLVLFLFTFTANATEEFFVRKSPLYEVVGQLGMWGTLINGIQAAGLEHKAMTQASWNGATSEFNIG